MEKNDYSIDVIEQKENYPFLETTNINVQKNEKVINNETCI